MDVLLALGTFYLTSSLAMYVSLQLECKIAPGLYFSPLHVTGIPEVIINASSSNMTIFISMSIT